MRNNYDAPEKYRVTTLILFHLETPSPAGGGACVGPGRGRAPGHVSEDAGGVSRVNASLQEFQTSSCDSSGLSEGQGLAGLQLAVLHTCFFLREQDVSLV